ncbi:hypothetical protein [Pantoea dispersa]|uniref:hypothetical protein n=1 Tax=Pantoea dispersa TaxID=59814 RepID=UPI0024B7AD2B|nr:hypothetical protein [Pantoea dispersa]MDI9766480.1 hypothetical protein [Pantoea dispersa]
MLRHRTTVKQLINQLRKMPQDALIVWQDHDHYEHEFNAMVNEAFLGNDALCENVGVEPGTIVALRG